MFMRVRFSRIVVWASLASIALVEFAVAETIYVDATATGPVFDGTTWCGAFRDLQDALAEAAPGDEIRVATGLYWPDRNSGDRLATFTLKSGVALMGGYAGCGAPNPSARDYTLYATTLSGDLLGNDAVACANYQDNSYHVVTYDDPAATGVILEGFTISGGNADGHDGLTNQGGGIHIRQGLTKCIPGGPTIRNCIVEKNCGEHHGAVNDHGLSTVIENCMIRDNHSEHEGGGLQIHSGSPTIINCTFMNNSSAGEGGGVWIGTDFDPTCSGPSNASFTNCVFDGNDADRGGGIFANFATVPTFTDCTFVRNHARFGGGAWLGPIDGSTTSGISNATFTNCVFDGNEAVYPGSGGGMFAADETAPTVTGCTFIRNSAAQNGGGVMFLESEPTFTDCRFIENEAVEKGGGLWGFGGQPTFERCVWDGNVASDGGGLYNAGFTSILTVADSVVRNNIARIDAGGSIYSGGGFSIYSGVRVTDTLFENNTAAERGGGVYNLYDIFSAGDPMQPQPSDYSVYENCTFRGNSAGHGGGFYGAYGSRLVLRGVVFEDNYASNNDGGGMKVNGLGGPNWADDPRTTRANLDGCTFRGNSSLYIAGGLGVSSGAIVTLVGCDFQENTSAHSAAGMHVHAYSRAIIFNSRFIGNSVFPGGATWGSGGALIAGTGVDILVANTIFSGNSSVYLGGAVQIQNDATATFVNSTFTRNVCPLGGDAVHAINSTVSIVNSIVWANEQGTGTALYTSPSNGLTVSHSDIQGGWPGLGNISTNPLFVNAVGPDGVAGNEDDDLRLAFGSPALDIGDASELPADVTDLDGDGNVAEPIPYDVSGEQRVVGSGLDMGAMESASFLCDPGTFSGSGEPPCTPCSPGFAQPSAGATECLACSPGTIAPSPGASTCSPCPVESYQPSPGATSCLSCSCNDKNGCTTNGCDAVTGACQNEPISGCTIPAASAWGLGIMSLLLMIAGTLAAAPRACR